MFRQNTAENLLPVDGYLLLYPGFYDAQRAAHYQQHFQQTIQWQQEKLFIFGRWHIVPRLMAWYGDEGADYRYSGSNHNPLPWTDSLQAIRTDVERCAHSEFNSVMLNLYRNGNDSMGCHADNEKELGENPLIASVSFGAQRILRFRHQSGQHKLDVPLESGDVLIMAGEIQHHWRHELPKTKRAKTARINLTFRKIIDLSL